MSDEPTIPDSRARKWLKAAAWIYIIGMFVFDLAGLQRQIVPPRYGMLVSYGAFALIMLAYRRPGREGWLLMLLGWAVIAVGTYSQLGIPELRANHSKP